MLNLALTLFFSQPTGFGDADRFDSIEDACATVSYELPEGEPQGLIYLWCIYRARHSIRGAYASRVDGSLIHDMDRPAAWKMYRWGVRVGRINPGACEFDRYDETLEHPKSERKLARNWPFRFVYMDADKAKRWMHRPYDVERYGTRGPIDNNTTVAREVLPGCWAPESLDRNDVAATVTVLRASKICLEHGCRRQSDIRRHW